jgi:hypothetical protein
VLLLNHVLIGGRKSTMQLETDRGEAW